MRVQAIDLECRCGSFRAVSNGMSRKPTMRAVCYCDDCQAYAHFLGKHSAVLDEHGGTETVWFAPADLRITQGAEHLGCVRLTAKGGFRWYAACSRTPFGNTAPAAGIPMVSVVHPMLGDAAIREQAYGPLTARIQGRFALGAPPPGTFSGMPLGGLLRAAGFLLRTRLRGQHKPSPVRDAKSGAPLVEPTILTTAERDALRPLCGAKP